jgi:hypothetical protein
MKRVHAAAEHPTALRRRLDDERSDERMAIVDAFMAYREDRYPHGCPLDDVDDTTRDAIAKWIEMGMHHVGMVRRQALDRRLAAADLESRDASMTVILAMIRMFAGGVATPDNPLGQALEAFAASRGGTHRAPPLPNAYPLFALDSDEDSESSCSGPFDTAEAALARAQERVAKGQDETPRRLRRCRRVRATELPIAKHLLEQLEEQIDTEVGEGSIPDLDHFARWHDQIVYATDNAEDALRTFLDTAFRVDMWAFDPDEEAPP